MRTILGIFDNRENAESAIFDFEAVGLAPKDISLVMKDASVAHDISDNTDVDVIEGAATGITTGAALGGLAGLLVGMGTIAIPGIGGLLIGGPLAAALGLTGATATTISGAATGALAGGLLGALLGLGLSEEDAMIYEQSIREGGILVAVPASSDQYEDVREIMKGNGATQIKTLSYQDIREKRYADEDVELPYMEGVQPSYSHIGAKGGKTKRKTVRN